VIQRKTWQTEKMGAKCGCQTNKVVLVFAMPHIAQLAYLRSQKRKNPTGIPAGSNATEKGSIQINGRGEKI
jgi:hypothetical protein